MKAKLHYLFTLYRGRLDRIRYINYCTALSLLLLALFVLFLLFIPKSYGFEITNFYITALLAYELIVLVFLLLSAYLFSIFTIARCHDFNKSGWFSLISIIPFGSLVIMFLGSKNKNNRFGPPQPKNSTLAQICAAIFMLIATLGYIYHLYSLIMLVNALFSQVPPNLNYYV